MIILKIQRAQKYKTMMKRKCLYYFRCQLSGVRGSDFQLLIMYPTRNFLCIHKHIYVA